MTDSNLNYSNYFLRENNSMKQNNSEITPPSNKSSKDDALRKELI